MNKSLLERFRAWLLLFIDFIKRTRREYANEFKFDKTGYWGKTPDVQRIEATYTFDIERHPISGYYYPTVSIAHKKYEKRIVNGIETYPLVLDGSFHCIHLSKSNNGLISVGTTSSRDFPFYSHQEALRAVDLYKEQKLRYNVNTSFVATVHAVIENGRPHIV